MHIAVDGERAEWVSTLRLGIWKTTLNLVAKFFGLLVRNRVSPTKADNALTWDRAVMVAALVAGFDIDFVCMLLAEIHERTFRSTTTLPFSCMNFQLCRDGGVSIWHYDKFVQAIGTFNICLIRDGANVGAPRCGPQIEDNLQADLDAILCSPTDELESAPTALVDDTVLDSLFSEDIALPEPTCACGKSPRSSRISNTTEDAREKKQERQENEKARRSSIVDEELRQ
uniref:Integrase core domain containing protein n=1 Tax=Solanum tuberosum TaxID=4113 RepID=M1DIM6_SOLTU